MVRAVARVRERDGAAVRGRIRVCVDGGGQHRPRQIVFRIKRAVAVAASVLSHLVYKAAALEEESELTI